MFSDRVEHEDHAEQPERAGRKCAGDAVEEVTPKSAERGVPEGRAAVVDRGGRRRSRPMRLNQPVNQPQAAPPSLDAHQ